MSIARGGITAGGITNGGILAGGILASQTESFYRDYSFYLNGIIDMVSGRSLSCLIPGTRYDLVNSVQTAFTTNTPVKTEKGIRTVGAYTNYFLNSGTPVTQSITLAAGTYTLAITGTGSAVYNGNTAVAETPVTFTLASSTTADCTITGSVLTVMLCQKKYAHPYIPTAGTAVSSVSESGTVVAGEATNGIFADEVPSNFTLLNTSLQLKGTLTLDWTPGYSAANVSGVPLNIISFDGSTKSISYDPSAKAIRITDSTRTLLSSVLNIVAGTTYSIKVSWGSGIMQVSVDSGDIAETVFDGSFNPGSDTVIGLSNAELQYVKNIKALKVSSHGTAATGLQEYLFGVVGSSVVSGFFQTSGTITVYWGDGTNNTYNGVTDQAYTKTYAASGNYTVRVVGKSLITKLTMQEATANIFCNTADLPININNFLIEGTISITGDIINIPRSCISFSVEGNNTVYGDAINIPSNSTLFRADGLTTISGRFWFPAAMKYLTIRGRTTIDTYTQQTLTFKPSTVRLSPVAPGGLSESEINQLLIDLDTPFIWTTGTIILAGTNAAPTGVGLTAKNNMIAEGASVITN